MVKDGVTYRFIRDVQGSVRLVVDAATGAVAQRLDYDSFGRMLADTNPGFQPFGFQSGLYDPDTGLVQFGARWYDAASGRWLSKDPILLEGGLNLYAFCGNDPVNYVDPLGLCEEVYYSFGFSDIKDSFLFAFGFKSPQTDYEREVAKVAQIAMMASLVTPGSLYGKGYPTKLNRAGNMQPYNPANGQYLSNSANPGIVMSPLGRFSADFAQGYAEAQGASGALPVGVAGEIGHAIGVLFGSLF